jgi:hypothetical protein
MESTLTPEKIVEKCSQEVANYFNWKEPQKFSIKIYDKWENLAEALVADDWAKERGITVAPKWLTAFVSKGRVINILAPEIFPERGYDPLTSFKKTIKHEVCHFYFGRPDLSRWLAEGVCEYVAEQKQCEIDEITIERLKQSDIYSDEAHSIGLSMVKKITASYGKEKLIELTKKKNNDEIYKELKEMFDWLK